MIKKTNILGTILVFALCMIAISGEAQNAARDYYNQAVEKTDQHAYVEAEKLYNKAIELNPLFHEAWFSLGYNLQMLGRYTEAIEKYSQAITLQPRDMYYLQRADAYMKLGKDVLAVWDCNLALEMNPDYIEAYYKRAMLMGSMRKTKEAIADYSRVLQMGWSDDKLYFEIGWLFETLNMADSAVRYYEMSIARVPSEKYAYIRMAETLEKTGNFERAFQTYNDAIEAFPDYGYAYYLRGYLLFSRLNKKEEGCKDLAKALSLGCQEAERAINNICR